MYKTEIYNHSTPFKSFVCKKKYQNGFMGGFASVLSLWLQLVTSNSWMNIFINPVTDHGDLQLSNSKKINFLPADM